jgi:hypothetical protein
MAALQPGPPFTLVLAMEACGVNNVLVFNGETPAKRFAEEIFDTDYITCMDKTFEELDADFKTYAELMAAQGQIHINPGTKKNSAMGER